MPTKFTLAVMAGLLLPLQAVAQSPIPPHMGWSSAWASLIAPCVASPAVASVANSKIVASTAADSLIMANPRGFFKAMPGPNALVRLSFAMICLKRY